jgi:hypothetical protein
MTRGKRLFLVGLSVLVVTGAVGCQPAYDRTTRPAQQRRKLPPDKTVRHIQCLFDAKPWLNLDSAGDRDPEGFRYRVYLRNTAGKSIYCDGRFDVEMYKIERAKGGEETRTLVSDWHYATSEFARIDRPGMLGVGYVVQFYWADKNLAGSEVEVITTFEDDYGHRVRSETYRLRIPKYRRQGRG